MPSKTYLPADPDAIGMADALDHDEPLNTGNDPDDDGLTRGGGVKIRDHVTLKPAPAPAPAPAPGPQPQQDFEPSFGSPKTTRSRPTPRPMEPTALSQPLNFAPGLPRDPRQVQQAKAKLHDTGTVYEPEREVPQHPEIKQTTVDGSAPSMGSMVTNIPSFAQQVYGDKSPSMEVADPLAVHGKDAHVPPTTRVNAPPPPIGSNPPPPAAAPAPVAPAPVGTTRVNAPPPPLGSRPNRPPAAAAAAAPRAVTPPPPPAPAPAPPVYAPAPAPAQETATTTTNTAPAPATSTTASTTTSQPQQQQPPAAEIPKNAKKVITTTTTTTKIVDGKEVVETHVHHDVILKKKGFGMPKFLKNIGKKKPATTTTTTTTTSSSTITS